MRPIFVGDHVHLGYGITAERITDPATELSLLPAIDFVVLSHLHGDHFDQIVEEKLDKSLPIISTPKVSPKNRLILILPFKACEGLAKKGFRACIPLEKWSSVVVRRSSNPGFVRITAMPGQHGPTLVHHLLPQTMGSMIHFSSPTGASYRIYISGDTLMFKEIKEIPRRFPDVNLCLLHLGGTRVFGVLVTMDPSQGIRVLQVVKPQHVIPIHYNDYTAFRHRLGDEASEDGAEVIGFDDFVRQVRTAVPTTTVNILRHGETYHFEPSRSAQENVPAAAPASQSQVISQ